MEPKHVAPLLLLVFCAFNVTPCSSKSSRMTLANASSRKLSFIAASCRATRYPVLCVKCLEKHANSIGHSKRRLTQTALLVSLARARSATAFAAKLSEAKGIRRPEYLAVKDCMETLSDSVDRLVQSVREMGRVSGTVGREFLLHMTNVQTWVSAALTDDNTCIEGFGSIRKRSVVKTAIRRRIVDVAQVTSNALALINRFASSHRASGESP